MQTVETLNEGLKRAFKITIPAKEIDARIDKELKTVAPRIRMAEKAAWPGVSRKVTRWPSAKCTW